MVTVSSTSLNCGIPDFLRASVGSELTPEDIDVCPGFTTKLLPLPALKGFKTTPYQKHKGTYDSPSVICAAFSGGYGLLGLSNGELLRWCSETGDFTTIRMVLSSVAGQTSAEKSDIRDVFLGPDGIHGIVRFSNGNVGYVSSQADMCTLLPSLKDYHIRCVCWDIRNVPKLSTTHEILIGTSQGIILSAVIAGSKDRIVRPVFTFPRKVSVERIVVFQHPPVPAEQDTISVSGTAGCDGVPLVKSNIGGTELSSKTAIVEFSIIVATATGLYRFSGGPTFEHAFQGISIPTAQYFRSDLAVLTQEQPTSAQPLHTPQKTGLTVSTGFSSNIVARSIDPIFADLSEAERQQNRLYEHLVLESPKESSMTQLLVTPASEVQDAFVKLASPDIFDKKAMTPRRFSSPSMGPHLLWWLTGAGVLVTVIKPPMRQMVDSTSTASKPALNESVSASDGSLFHKKKPLGYQITLPPLIIPFASPTKEGRVTFQGKDNAAGALSTAQRGSSRFRLRTDQTPEARFLSDATPAITRESSIDGCRSVALTSCYLLMLYESRLVIISRITRAVVQHLSLPAVRYGVVRKLVQDTQTETTFLVTSRYIFQLIAHREHECVWLQFLAVRDFPSAIRSLRPDHRAYNILCCEFGKYLLRSGQCSRGAEVLALCPSIPLEDLFLRFWLNGRSSEMIISVLTTLLSLFRKRTGVANSLQSSLVFHLGKKLGAVKTEAKQRWIVVLQLWLLDEMVQSLNDSEFKIERLKHYRQFHRMKEPNKVVSVQCDTQQVAQLCVSPEGYWIPHDELTKSLSQRITLEIHNRKALVESIHSLMHSLRYMGSQLGEPLYMLFEYLGRPYETLAWATFIDDQEMQVLECINQQDFAGALRYLAADPPISERDTTKLAESVRETSSRHLNTTPDVFEWRSKQLRLISTFGPLLFLNEPARFAALLLRPDILSPSVSDGLVQYIEVKTLEDPAFIDLLHPILLATASIPPQPQPSPHNEYTDVHRMEAIKLFTRFISSLILGVDLVESTRLTGHDKVRRTAIPLRKGLDSWTGINGVWNGNVCVLASCLAAEDELVQLISGLSKSLNDSGRTALVKPDLLFSLRFCIERGQNRAALLLLTLLGMYQDVVRVALATGDLEMAKLAVQCVPLDSEVHGTPLKRVLWKSIIQAAAKTMDAPSLMELLQESNGVLRLHEHLEFLSGPSVIAAYRDVLCREFDFCEKRIREKQDAIRHNREAIESLKAKLKSQRAVPIMEVSNSRTFCLLCQAPAGADRFYIYPCKHTIHAVCAHRLKWPFMDLQTREKYKHAVSELQKIVVLSQDKRSDDNSTSDNVPHDLNGQKLTALTQTQMQNWQRREREVDQYLNDECPLCGDWLIETITVPFFSSSELGGIQQSQCKNSMGQRVKPDSLDPSQHWIIGDGPLPGKKSRLP